jgi:hypothetical protein
MVQGEDKVFRRAPSWRKRFRPRDHHGGGMLGTSAETLPAGFRVSTLGPLQPPPAPAKKMMPEGEGGTSWAGLGSWHPRPGGGAGEASAALTAVCGGGRCGAGRAEPRGAAGGRAGTNPALCSTALPTPPSRAGGGAETGDLHGSDLLLLTPTLLPRVWRGCAPGSG